MAATIKAETELDSEIVGGSLGQFDVEVDGLVIASKQKGLLKGKEVGGWPDPQLVIAVLEKLQSQAK